MKRRTFLIGCGILAITGYSIIKHIQQKQHSAANRVLKTVKAQLGKQAPIVGSWIEEETVASPATAPRHRFYGGITRDEKGQLKTYSFVADATTGHVLTLTPLD
ncbi:hypothetical protein ACI3E1_01165 [Ligilactobacillus sp. LYQ139]|uniref:hypothetical protein n=1 Tax=Ligilactobacillus sp. LYQ139 TaxID=3378800 RepID=UPI0038534668